MKGRSGDLFRAARCVSGMKLDPVQTATFYALTASGPATMGRVHCAIPLTRPRAEAGVLAWG